MYDEIINLYLQNSNSELAHKMAAYMKDNFTYLGIQKPVRAKLQKTFIKTLCENKAIDWDFVRLTWVWREREWQYLALDYLVAVKKHFAMEDIDKLQYLIENKPWWDTVDIIATNLVGSICSSFPELIKNYILKWADSDNMWLRRSAILFQLKYKEHTDAQLLSQIILKNNNSKEFFINKAIGWALREYSKTDQAWVKYFLDKNSLHPLTVREASKYL